MSMLQVRWAGVAAAVALAVAGCNGSSVVGGPADAGDDLAVDLGADTSTDLGPDVTDAGADVPADLGVDATDAGDDVPVDVPMDAPTRCASDADCVGDPRGPACDTATGACVACTAASDRCPVGRYCRENTCVAGCRDDDACEPPRADDAGVDAGGGPPPLSRCDTTTRACVECLRDEHCPAGTLCVGNVCVSGCNAGRACPGQQQCCAGACIEVSSNVANCGGCGTACTVANAAPSCQNGMCAVGVCTAPFADCDLNPANGCEADTFSDLSHCGGCGMACADRPNATPRCAAGRCEYACNAGFADCDGNPDNGCEVDTRGDTTHCGGCGRLCNPPNGSPVCAMGACGVTCSPGFADCDANATNGCEVDTRTSVTHCGGCGMTCPDRDNAFPGCLGSRCVSSCVMGFQDCDGDATNGCEVDIRSQVTDCGACGRACAPPRGTGTCAMGRCTIARCDDGYADCDGDASNGCEVNLRSDAAHCSACGNACMVSGGTPACVAGACGVAACSPGRGDCDGSATNGCETDITTSVGDCGGCGSACSVPNATPACVAGRCAVGSCNAGFADCDGNAGNGCETDTRSTATACGACGRGCALSNATAACAASRCVIASCNAGYADCDGNPDNGCEVDTRTSPSHCGGCGSVCAVPNATAACAASRCAVGSCNAGFADCDGNAGNGCETNTGSTPSSCGSCGNVCRLPNTAVNACVSGSCRVQTCAGGFGDCDGAPSNGCEANLATDVNNCGACGNRPSEACNLADDNCNGVCDDRDGCRTAVHRSLHPSTGEHFYTVSSSEAACCGFRVENLNYYYLYSSTAPGLLPFYRCYMSYGKHFYTTASNCEGISPGTVEGVMGYIATSASCGAVPLYRTYRPGNGDHFYTTSVSERNSALSSGYINEGIAGYVWPTPRN